MGLYGELGKYFSVTKTPVVVVTVLGTGWSWTCYLAQVVFETVMSSRSNLDDLNRLSDVLKTGHFSTLGQIIHWGDIGDYASLLLGKSCRKQSAKMAAEAAVKVRDKFLGCGWKVHKETAGSEVTSLGMSLDVE